MFIYRRLSHITVVLACYWTTGCINDAVTVEQVGGFQETVVEYRHQWDESTHPFTGAAVIDIDGDGKVEVFVGGGKNQADALFSYQQGRLVNIIDGTGLSNAVATYGSVSIDIDNDRDTDLVVARNDGVYLYVNSGGKSGGKFAEKKIPLNLPANSVPLAIAASDIDHDGDADLYISVFVDIASFRSGVFNDPSHAKSNLLLLNNGDLTFTDITASSNTAGKQNTFLSVFVDLNADGWQDLVISQNTGEIEILRNNRDKTFTAMPIKSGFGFWMGLATGDIDNDGDQDLFFSNAGDSIPAFLTKGDIRDDQKHQLEWLLLRNDGGFQFTDITTAYQIDGEGFAWGAVFEDLNLDGRLDLLVSQNYIKWPVHKLFKLPGRTYLQTDSKTNNFFKHTKSLGLENRFYGQSPLIADLDNDGRPDVLWLNMDGPLRAFINQSPANYLTIAIPDTANLLGTRISIETSAGKSYTKEVVTSTGMLTDQTTDLVFGLGVIETVERVTITRPNNTTETIESPGINTTITIN